MEPTVKTSDGTVLLKGSGTEVSLDESAKSISMQAKYTDGSKEFTFLVRKFTNLKQVCLALKGEVEKYDNVISDYSVDRYRADLGDGNNVLCTVEKKNIDYHYHQ